MTKWIAGLALSGALAFAAPSTAEAQGGGPVFTGGLVNVTITDVIDGDVLSNFDIGVAAALNLAANVCDLNVAALNLFVEELEDEGEATCTARNGRQEITLTQDP